MAVKKSNWYRLDPAEMLVEMLDCTAAEWFMRSKAIARALAKREKGLDDWADRMIEDSEIYIGQRLQAARNSVASRLQRNSDSVGNETAHPVGNETAIPFATKRERNSDSVGNETATKATQRARETEPKPKPITDITHRTEPTVHQPPPIPQPLSPSAQRAGKRSVVGSVENIGDFVGSVSVGSAPPPSSSSKEQVWCIPSGHLAAFAAASLGDGDSDKAEQSYSKQLRIIGAAAFRETLATLLSEIDAGERPNNPGAVFTARLKRCKGQ